MPQRLFKTFALWLIGISQPFFVHSYRIALHHWATGGCEFVALCACRRLTAISSKPFKAYNRALATDFTRHRHVFQLLLVYKARFFIDEQWFPLPRNFHSFCCSFCLSCPWKLPEIVQSFLKLDFDVVRTPVRERTVTLKRHFIETLYNKEVLTTLPMSMLVPSLEN